MFLSLAIFSQGVLAQVGLDQTAAAAGLNSNTSIAKIAGQIIYAILGFLGLIFIILLIYGGFMRMTAQGNTEQISKSMGIITSAIVGVIIIIASYTITAFVMSRVGASVGGGGGMGGTVCEKVGEPCDGGNGYWADDEGICICVPSIEKLP